LYCKGCYASSKAASTETLDWTTLDKIVQEAHDEMGMRFSPSQAGSRSRIKAKGKQSSTSVQSGKTVFS